MGNRWPLPVFTIANIPISQWLAIEQFDKSIRNLSAIIETLINDETFFIPLSIKLANQFILSFDTSIRHIDVTNFSSRSFVYSLTVGFDPRQVAQAGFIVHGFDDHRSRT